jgi:hypothetical protein
MKPVIKTFTNFIVQDLHKYKEGDLVGRLTEYIVRNVDKASTRGLTPMGWA